MTGLKWLKLNRTNIDWVPEEMVALTQLESLSFARNNLVTLHGEIPQMNKLRYFNCRYNNLKNSGIPAKLVNNEELLVIDLSHNQLKEVPDELEQSKKLLVLNLSHNMIEVIPAQLFVNLCDLIFLDLSDNQLGELNCIIQLPSNLFIL